VCDGDLVSFLQSNRLRRMTGSQEKLITSLNLYHASNLQDLTPLSTLINLQKLYLYGTSVSDLTPLSTLINLQYLDLNDTRVRDISPLSTLTELRVLDLAYDDIDDITPLSTLTKLQILDLRRTTNQIDEIQELLPHTRILY